MTKTFGAWPAGRGETAADSSGDQKENVAVDITHTVLAQRLKEARESSQVTQEQVAEALGLHRTAMAHLETGNRSVSTLELATLAKLYHRDIASFFAAEESPAENDTLLALYRINKDFQDNPQVRENVARCIDICREGAQLEALLDFSRRSGPPAYRLEPPGNPAEAVHQGEHVAAEERKRITMGDSPIPDMADLIAAQGVWASGTTLPDAMSGLFVQHPSLGQVILVNFDHSRTRKRFSYAHEYGHCLMDRQQSVSVTTAANQGSLSEVRANAFAAAFLMPAAGVAAFLNSLDKGAPSRQTLHVYSPITERSAEPTIGAQRRPAPGSQVITYQDAAQLAYRFVVSYKAVVYRLRNLNLTSRAETESLLANEDHAADFLKMLRLWDVLEKDQRENEPESQLDRELVSQVAYLAVEAYRREEISRGKLLEISAKLGLSGNKLVALARAAANTA
jgi:Zn-dependent peptidase ImmA (M78 family)/DNA-binding XRE family transcriptional regulator